MAMTDLVNFVGILCVKKSIPDQTFHMSVYPLIETCSHIEQLLVYSTGQLLHLTL